MAASSLDGDSFVWKTTPKEPFPTILHWVYCKSRVSPVMPSWTFSLTISKAGQPEHTDAFRARVNTYHPSAGCSTLRDDSVPSWNVWSGLVSLPFV